MPYLFPQSLTDYSISIILDSQLDHNKLPTRNQRTTQSTQQCPDSIPRTRQLPAILGKEHSHLPPMENIKSSTLVLQHCTHMQHSRHGPPRTRTAQSKTHPAPETAQNTSRQKVPKRQSPHYPHKTDFPTLETNPAPCLVPNLPNSKDIVSSMAAPCSPASQGA